MQTLIANIAVRLYRAASVVGWIILIFVIAGFIGGCATPAGTLNSKVNECEAYGFDGSITRNAFGYYRFTGCVPKPPYVVIP